MCGDRPSFSAVRILDGMTRNTAPAPLAIGKHVGAEPRQVRDLVGEVGIVLLGEFLRFGAGMIGSSSRCR